MCSVPSGLFTPWGYCTHTVPVVVLIEPYTFESRIHKLLNITERLAGVQLSTLFLLQLRLTDAAVFLQLPVQQ